MQATAKIKIATLVSIIAFVKKNIVKKMWIFKKYHFVCLVVFYWNNPDYLFCYYQIITTRLVHLEMVIIQRRNPRLCGNSLKKEDHMARKHSDYLLPPVSSQNKDQRRPEYWYCIWIILCHIFYSSRNKSRFFYC